MGNCKNCEKYISCNEIRCPDYPYCYYESSHGRLDKCQKRINECLEMMEEDKQSYIIWYEKGND